MFFDDFNLILKNWSADTSSCNLNIESIIQFGSTCHSPIKKQTDIDLLYIIKSTNTLTRIEQFHLTKDWDNDLDKKLSQFKDYNLISSTHVKSLNQLSQLSPMYLDFPETSHILFDRTGLGRNLLSNITNWIVKNNAKKVQKGALWYWIYDDQDPSLPVSFLF